MNYDSLIVFSPNKSASVGSLVDQEDHDALETYNGYTLSIIYEYIE